MPDESFYPAYAECSKPSASNLPEDCQRLMDSLPGAMSQVLTTLEGSVVAYPFVRDAIKQCLSSFFPLCLF